MPSYKAVTDPAELEALVGRLLSDHLPFGFDIETGYDGADRPQASLHPEEGKIVGFSFTNSTQWARYVPLAHDTGPNMDPAVFATYAWPLLTSGLGVAHNAKFELRYLSRFFRQHRGEDPSVLATRGYFPVRSDTMIEASILANWQSNALKYLTKMVFGHDQAELASLFPELKKNQLKSLRFNVLDLTPAVVDYACEDSVWCLALHLKHHPQVADDFLYKAEMTALGVFCAMEDHGVLYDWALMSAAKAELETFMHASYAEICKELTALVGHPVSPNLGSPKQVSELLFGELGMKTSRKTDKGTPSTDAIALATLAKSHPVVGRLLSWREQRKLAGSYLEKYPKEFSYADDGRTHPNHRQTGVASGRIAVDSPPYQQSPRFYHYETASGASFDMNFRDAIKAGPGHYFMVYDYGQVELRALGGESGEPMLLRAFAEGVDVHTATASLMLGVPVDQVSKEQRQVGKTMNFALLYGMGAEALADRLGIAKEEGEKLYAQYFSAFSAIKVWIDRQVETGKATGTVHSKFGRKIVVWEFQSPDRWIYSKGERQCVNAPIQGAAADYMTIAMVRQQAAVKAAGLSDKVHLIMQIHDSLVFEVHKSVKPQAVFDVIQPAVVFPVPGWPQMVADWGIGTRWGSLTDIEIMAGTPAHPAGIIKLAEKPKEKDEAPSEDDVGEALPSGPVPLPTTKLAPVSNSLVPAVPAPVLPAPNPPSAAAATPEPGLVGLPPGLPSTHSLAPSGLEGVEDDGIGRTLIVHITEMPDTVAWARFTQLCEANPGSHGVTLLLPEHGEVPTGLSTALSPMASAWISVIFSGAEVFYAPESVDPAAVLSGLQL